MTHVSIFDFKEITQIREILEVNIFVLFLEVNMLVFAVFYRNEYAFTYLLRNHLNT